MTDAETGGSNYLDKNLDLFSFSLMLRYVIIGYVYPNTCILHNRLRPGPRTPGRDSASGKDFNKDLGAGLDSLSIA